jgi:hypothetical protein
MDGVELDAADELTRRERGILIVIPEGSDPGISCGKDKIGCRGELREHSITKPMLPGPKPQGDRVN